MVGTPPGLLDNPQAGAGADLPLRADNAFVLDLTRAGAGGPRKRKRRATTRRPTAPADGVYEIRAVLGERQSGDAREVRLQWQDGELPDEWVPFTDLMPDTREWAEAELRYQKRHSFGPSDRAAAPSGDELSSWAGARVLVDLARERLDEDHSESGDDEAASMSDGEGGEAGPAPSSKGGQDSVDSVVPWISVAEARNMTLPADGEYAPRNGAAPPCAWKVVLRHGPEEPGTRTGHAVGARIRRGVVGRRRRDRGGRRTPHSARRAGELPC